MTPPPRSRRSSVVRRDVYAKVVLTRDGTEVASWPLTGAGRPDLVIVDRLPRLQLAARRVGCSIRLRDPCVELSELLDMLGLGEVVPGPTGLLLKASREAERSEQVGVEEVVVPDDPSG
jgi:hypothetical protein